MHRVNPKTEAAPKRIPAPPTQALPPKKKPACVQAVRAWPLLCTRPMVWRHLPRGSLEHLLLCQWFQEPGDLAGIRAPGKKITFCCLVGGKQREPPPPPKKKGTDSGEGNRSLTFWGMDPIRKTKRLKVGFQQLRLCQRVHWVPFDSLPEWMAQNSELVVYH